MKAGSAARDGADAAIRLGGHAEAGAAAAAAPAPSRHLSTRGNRVSAARLADNGLRIKGRFAKVNSDADLAGMVTAQSCPDLSRHAQGRQLDEERAKDSSSDSTKQQTTAKVKAEPRRSRLRAGGRGDTDGKRQTEQRVAQEEGVAKVLRGGKGDRVRRREVFKKVGSLRTGGKPMMPRRAKCHSSHSTRGVW